MKIRKIGSLLCLNSSPQPPVNLSIVVDSFDISHVKDDKVNITIQLDYAFGVNNLIQKIKISRNGFRFKFKTGLLSIVSNN